MPTKAVDGQFIVPLEELLEAGCHFGHQSRRWHPKMGVYIWAERDGVHIIDLAKTQQKLNEAAKFLYNLTREGKAVVFVGTKRQASTIIEEEATKAAIPYVSKRWLGGTMTNWKQLKKSIDQLHDLETKREAGDLERYTKKERVLIDREISRLNRIIGGLRGLTKPPEVLFVVDVKREEAAIREARKLGIPVVAIVDTNCNPQAANLVIPANDDAIRSIRLITSKLAEAVARGKVEHAVIQEAAAKEAAKAKGANEQAVAA